MNVRKALKTIERAIRLVEKQDDLLAAYTVNYGISQRTKDYVACAKAKCPIDQLYEKMLSGEFSDGIEVEIPNDISEGDLDELYRACMGSHDKTAQIRAALKGVE